MARRRHRTVRLSAVVVISLLLVIMWLGTEIARFFVTASTSCGAL